ncbi:hypothetical protein P879_08885 [Paragonimus westermani]|uniref:Transmembrane protein 209 n=1 Tax=Paragonimus westermani TaxID=34504 RepID=A0A8T0D065_9TREM|nr:hypothetical protein P879_08885 [Paragonimus westermani]
MWVSRDPEMLRAEQRERKIHMISVANKWLVVNLLVELCIIIELKVLPLFQLLGIPKRFLSFYWKFGNFLVLCILLPGIAFLVVSAISAFCHLCTICRAVISLKLRDSKRMLFTTLSPNVSPGRKLYGPTMFSNLAPSFESSHNKGGFLSHSISGTCEYLKSNSASPSRGDPSPSSWNSSNASLCSPLWDKTRTHSSSSTCTTIGSVSLLNIALSPITGPPLLSDSYQVSGLDSSVSSITSNGIRSNTWSSPLWTSAQSPSYQYQLSCTPPASPKRGMLDDQPSLRYSILSTSVCCHKHSQSDLGFVDLRYCRQYNKEQPTERAADEYWEEHQVTAACLEQYTMDLRKWLHGTIFRRLVDEIAAVNRHLRETYGEETVIGSTTLDTLQLLCSTKYQYLPTLPVLLSFLEFTKDHGYLVNRLRELSRGGCLEEFRWDSGSRSSCWPWKEHLPNDSLILLHMFSTYMDARMPPHPKCLTGRVFSQLCVVRHPDKPDLKSKFNTQLYQLSVQPPHFKLVLNGKVYSFPAGPKNLFHAILMCFHHAFTVDGKFRSINLGSSGLNVAWIFSKQ